MSDEDPDIKVRDVVREDKEERKGGAPIIPWLSGSKAPGLPPGLSWLQALLTSESGLFGLAVAVVATATLASTYAPLLQEAIFGKPPVRAAGLHSGGGTSQGELASDNGYGDSLGYFRNANQGALAEGSSAAPAAAGAAEASKSEGATGADKAGDPAAWASALAGAGEVGGGKDGKEDGRPRLPDKGFGKLSSALGSGSSSGSRGAAGTFPASGGARTEGGSGGRLKSAAGASRRLSAAGRGANKGGTMSVLGQLKRASSVSRSGVGMNAEAARATEAQAFDGGAGKPTEGQGIGTGGVGTGASESAPSQSATRDQKETPAPDPGPGKDETPWKNSLMIAKMLLLIADMMLVMAAMMKKEGEVLTFGLGSGMASLLAQGAILLGLIVVGIGYGIMKQHGQAAQGQMLMLAGGVAAAGAALALAIGKAQSLLLMLAAAGSGLIGMMGTSLGGKSFGFGK